MQRQAFQSVLLEVQIRRKLPDDPTSFPADDEFFNHSEAHLWLRKQPKTKLTDVPHLEFLISNTICYAAQFEKAKAQEECNQTMLAIQRSRYDVELGAIKNTVE